jgi:hypothetical protein
MIGYHYTTRENWCNIQVEGMEPAPIRQHEYDHFRVNLPELQREAIWIWKKPLVDEHAWITIINLAAMHKSFEIVLLEIIYEEKDACSHIYLREEDKAMGSRVDLTCSFSAGEFSTGQLPMELLANHVPPCRIAKVWEADLLADIRKYHARTQGESVCV